MAIQNYYQKIATFVNLLLTFIELFFIVASEARDLLSDAVHFHCLGTHTQVASFDMYLIPGESGGDGRGAGFLSPISSQTARNFKKLKIQYESR